MDLNDLSLSWLSIGGKDQLINAQVSLTKHVEFRCTTRNVTEDEILYVIEHGRRCYRAGVLVYFLGKRDIPLQDRKDQRIAQLEGLNVLTNPESDGSLVVITIYRNRKGFRNHRRKLKRAI